MKRRSLLSGLAKGWTPWLLGLGAISVITGVYMTAKLIPMAWMVGRPILILPGLVFGSFGLLLFLAIIRDSYRQ